MKVAVVGLGLFGKSLALHLAKEGVEVIAIDAKAELVDDVKDDVAVAVKLDATDERELRSQGVHTAQALVASIGDNFETNLMVVILARKMGIPRVLARAPSEVHSRILQMIGAEEVVLPEERAAETLARRLVRPSLKAYFDLIDGYSVAEIEAPQSFHGKKLSELELKTKSHVNLIAIKRPAPGEPERATINVVPLGSDTILPGDLLAVAARDEDLEALLAETGK